MAEEGKKFTIKRLYLKDVSFESPDAPEVFRQRLEPKIEIVLSVGLAALGEDRHEVVLTCTVTARADDKVVFLCEVAQAGVFLIQGYADTELNEMLSVACPTQLFPFLRAEIVHLATHGGFPPVLLAPVNFEQMYAASKRASAPTA